jgi:uncharacterized RDD family membrane protein YckC
MVLPLQSARRLLAFWLRRGVAFAIDVAIVQILAHAALNTVAWRMPLWVCPLVLPLVYVGYAMTLTSFGPEARTWGKKLLGLAIRATDGSRPRPTALLARSGALAIMLLVDWADLLAGASDPVTLGTLLIVSIAVGTVVLSYGAMCQIRGGSPTPHDAIAGTQVVRLGEETETLAASSSPTAPVIPVALAVVVVAALFVVGLVSATTREACPPCRDVESRAAERYGALTRVTMQVHRTQSTGAPLLTHLDTRVWMPVAVALRPERDSILDLASQSAEAYARMQGLVVDRRTVTEELAQMPFVLEETRDLAHPDQISLRLEIGTGGVTSLVDIEIGLGLDFAAVPYR